MLPKILRSDIRIATLEKLTNNEFNSLRDVIKRLDIFNIDTVDVSYLPWLAWWFRVDVWDEEWEDKQKRDVIKEALILFKYKGTIWAVERALSLTGYDSTVLPWYAQTPTATRGTFTIDVRPQNSERLFQSIDYERIFRLVESNKQGSQTWIGTITNKIDGLGYFACITRSNSKTTIGNKA